MNLFEAVKDSVTTRQAAELYGIHVGRSGMAVCPFHNDRNPSMKVDRRFHCFGCQADGDVIDFVARLFDLGKKAAAEKLAADFGILYDGKSIVSSLPKRKEVSEEKRFRHAVDHCYRVLCNYLHLLRQWRTEYAPRSTDEKWHPLFVEALQRQTYVEYLLDMLLFGSVQEQAEVIAEFGREVPSLEKRISEFAAGAAAGSIECD
jgi:hypothetical protein